jgi:hypothetical protein
MRLALVIAPSDPRSGEATLRREALAWLRGRLARHGFHVVIVGGVQDPEAAIAKAVERVAPGDTVLVHASGRLAGRDAIAFGETGVILLASLTDALVERAPAHVSFVLELTHEEEENDALLAAEILGSAIRSLGARVHGYPVLAAVRPLGTPVDRLAFTRLALPAANDDAGPPPTEALVASMYDAASATDESHAVAQSFTFVRGGSSIAPPPPAHFAPENSAPDTDRLLPDLSQMPDVVRMAQDAMAEVAVSSVPPPPEDFGNEPSIHSQIAEAIEMRDWPRAVELRRHRLHQLASPRQKARELVAIARILQAELGDAEGAIESLEMARAMDARPISVLQALRRGYERLGRWVNVVEVTGALADLTESPVERAQLRLACARMAFERLADAGASLAWLEAAVADDPSNAEAYSALAQLRAHMPAAPAYAEPQAPVVETYSPVVPPAPAVEAYAPVMVQAPVVEAYAPVMARAPVVEAYAPVMAQAPVVEAYAPAVAQAPVIQAYAPAPAIQLPPPMPRVGWDAGARERSADRLVAEGADDDALAELEVVTAREPTRVSAYEKTFAVHRRAGRTDAAYLAALALEELDAADVDQQVLIEQFRTVGPATVRASLDDAAWRALQAPGSDDVLAALFGAVERAAIAARVDELREQRRLVVLDPSDRLSETSTASIVRSCTWAARVLSVACPGLYLRDDAAGIEAILAREPSIGLGPSVVSGPTAKDLAFLAGRHLTLHRRGHQVVLYYPDRDSLTTLLLASVQVVMPKAAAPSDDPAVRNLRSRLARYIEPDDRAALAVAVRALDARGGQASLGAWMSSVELTAARVGLLLCGDLATAMAIVRAESRDAGNLTRETRRGDLVAFCAGRAHVTTRKRFVTTAPESLQPPPPPSSSSLQLAP